MSDYDGAGARKLPPQMPEDMTTIEVRISNGKTYVEASTRMHNLELSMMPSAAVVDNVLFRQGRDLVSAAVSELRRGPKKEV